MKYHTEHARIASYVFAITSLFSCRTASAGNISIFDNGPGQVGFYQNGSNFIPRGVDFVTLTAQGSGQYQANFDPGTYDSSDVHGEMQYIAYSGYNLVRVNMSSGYTDNGYGLSSPGVSSAWLANVADFLQAAYDNNVQVLLTVDSLPSNYNSFLGSSSDTTYSEIDNFNTPFLDTGFAKGLAQNFLDIVNGVKSISPTAESAIMGMEVQNEGYVLPNCEPFGANFCSKGTTGPAVSTVEVNGVTYNMSSNADRQQLVDAGTDYLIALVRNAVRTVDPSILVSAGAFTFEEGGGAPSPNGVHAVSTALTERYPIRPFMIGVYDWGDFMDVHVYPRGSGWSLANDLGSSEITTGSEFTRPLIMGEYGASKPLYPTVSSAANVLTSLLSTSCSYPFDGWLLWTWDTTNQTGGTWSAKEDNGAINGVVAPKARPTICN